MAMRTIPSAEKVMNYGVPTLKVDGKPIIAVGANKNHFSVYPYGGSAIEANKALLKDAEFSKGTIRFGYDNLPSQEILDAIVSYKLKY